MSFRGISKPGIYSYIRLFNDKNYRCVAHSDIHE